MKCWLLWKSLKADRTATTAIEYALIGLMIFVVIVGSLTGLGSHVNNAFNAMKNTLPH